VAIRQLVGHYFWYGQIRDRFFQRGLQTNVQCVAFGDTTIHQLLGLAVSFAFKRCYIKMRQ